MTSQSEAWLREIEEISQDKVTEVAALAFGYCVGEMADRILSNHDGVCLSFPSQTSYQKIHSIARAVGREVVDGARSDDFFLRRFPTIHQWIAKNRTTIALIRAGNVFAYVGFGKILHSTHSEEAMKHQRVTQLIWVHQDATVFLP